MRSAFPCATCSISSLLSGCRLRNSTAVTLDSYGQSTENSTFFTPSAFTVGFCKALQLGFLRTMRCLRHEILLGLDAFIETRTIVLSQEYANWRTSLS